MAIADWQGRLSGGEGRRKFWAVAARMNSSCAPLDRPQFRNRGNPLNVNSP
jgi:methyl-accepting chemotaxis protein